MAKINRPANDAAGFPSNGGGPSGIAESDNLSDTSYVLVDKCTCTVPQQLVRGNGKIVQPQPDSTCLLHFPSPAPKSEKGKEVRKAKRDSGVAGLSSPNQLQYQSQNRQPQHYTFSPQLENPAHASAPARQIRQTEYDQPQHPRAALKIELQLDVVPITQLGGQPGRYNYLPKPQWQPRRGLWDQGADEALSCIGDWAPEELERLDLEDL